MFKFPLVYFSARPVVVPLFAESFAHSSYTLRMPCGCTRNGKPECSAFALPRIDNWATVAMEHEEADHIPFGTVQAAGGSPPFW